MTKEEWNLYNDFLIHHQIDYFVNTFFLSDNIEAMHY